MASRKKPQPPNPEVEPPQRLVTAAPSVDDERLDRSFRPRRLADFVGQERHKENLGVYVQAARRRGEPLDHLLISGPPGLGKTTLAHILAEEMGVGLHLTSGPTIDHKGVLAGLLTRLERGDVLFIDEIHRLAPAVEEALYSAIEDFHIDVMLGEGALSQSMRLELQPFTLVAATTRTGMLTRPLHDRFGVTIRLDFYPVEDLERIVLRNAALLGLEATPGGARALAERSRGTPRIANRMLRRARDFAEVAGDRRLTEEVVAITCERLEVDQAGLDEMDRRLLRVLVVHHEGGPVGVETLAAALAEPRDTVEDVYEPYLLQQGFIARTPRGRVATARAWEHLGIPRRSAPAQGTLF